MKTELGTRIPDEIKERLWQLIGQSAENPSLAHYARYDGFSKRPISLTRTQISR